VTEAPRLWIRLDPFLVVLAIAFGVALVGGGIAASVSSRPFRNQHLREKLSRRRWAMHATSRRFAGLFIA
jgi:hypothetical protein